MKNRIKRFLVLSIILWGMIPQESSAQKSVKSLQECIQTAVDNNLILKSGRVSIERSKDLMGTAFNPGKTTLSMSQDPTSGGSPDNSLSVIQSFSFPTLYTSRKSLLKAETNLERSNLEVSKNELSKEVTSAYFLLLHSRENIRLLEKQDSIYGKFKFLASAKFKSGEANHLEQMNAERLYNENKITLENEKKNYRNRQLVLQQWLNTEEWIDPVESSLPILDNGTFMRKIDLNQTPIYQYFESKKEVNQKNLNYIRQGFLPDFNFSLRSQYLMKGFNPYDISREPFSKGNFMGFEVGISLPLFFWEQKSKTKAARKEMDITGLQQDATLLSIQKSYETAINDLDAARTKLEYYLNVGNKQADDIARISQLSYEKGDINYIEYIQNLKTSVEIRLQYVDAVNDYNQAVIMLNYLQGKQQ